MRPLKTIYPSLGRYFLTVQDLADAGCMSRARAWQCLKGEREFTEQEKRAIANNIIVRFYTGEIEGHGKANEVEDLIEARLHFDEVFKRTA